MVESRLFSEGLHVLGAAPSAAQMEQYLSAFFGDDLPLQVHAAPPQLPVPRSCILHHDGALCQDDGMS